MLGIFVVVIKIWFTLSTSTKAALIDKKGDKTPAAFPIGRFLYLDQYSYEF